MKAILVVQMIVNFCFLDFSQSLADYLNMSERKVENATQVHNYIRSDFLIVKFSFIATYSDKMQADRMMISLEKEAFPSLNGCPGKTLHSVNEPTQSTLEDIITYSVLIYFLNLPFFASVCCR